MSGPVAAQSPVGLPRMFSTFLPMNAAIGAIMVIAAFLAAAISAVVEFGAADTVSGRSQVPASSAFILRSPM